jgi:hypothetical protein
LHLEHQYHLVHLVGQLHLVHLEDQLLLEHLLRLERLQLLEHQ